MSKRDPEVALRQVLSSAQEAVEILKGKTRLDLDSDRLLPDTDRRESVRRDRASRFRDDLLCLLLLCRAGIRGPSRLLEGAHAFAYDRLRRPAAGGGLHRGRTGLPVQ